MTQKEVQKLETNYYKELEIRREVAKNYTGQVAGRHSDMFSNREMDWMCRGYVEGFSKAKETEKERMIQFALDYAMSVFGNTFTDPAIIEMSIKQMYNEKF
jgi:aromatic ring hydroxylase